MVVLYVDCYVMWLLMFWLCLLLCDDVMLCDCWCVDDLYLYCCCCCDGDGDDNCGALCFVCCCCACCVGVLV